MTTLDLTDPPNEPEAHTAVSEFKAAAELAKYKVQLEEERRVHVRQLEGKLKARWSSTLNERTWTQDDSFFSEVIALHRDSLQRARNAAEVVQKSSATLATLYGVGLGVTFSVTDRPLPIRGVVPLIFLGISVVAATFYIAWIHRDSSPNFEFKKWGNDVAAGTRKYQQKYTEAYAQLVLTMILDRAYALRTGVVALLLGLIFLPAPFVDIGGSSPGTSQAEPSLVPWPTETHFTSTRLAAVVLEAEVAEVAELRAAARSAARTGTQSNPLKSPANYWWLGAGAVGLIVVIVVWFRRSATAIKPNKELISLISWSAVLAAALAVLAVAI